MERLLERERLLNGNGTEMERKWNGKGTERERNRTERGTVQERKKYSTKDSINSNSSVIELKKP